MQSATKSPGGADRPRDMLSAMASRPRVVPLTLVRDEEHASQVTHELVLGAKRSLWISTANAKDVRVPAPIGTRARAKGSYVSLLEMLGERVRGGLDLRFLHAGLPSRPFRAALAETPELSASIRCCPRVHLKVVVQDAEALYLGSANFTGAGLGEKSDGRRNFELGIVVRDDVLLDTVQERFDRIWRGAECAGCKLRRECPEPIDTALARKAAAKAGARPKRTTTPRKPAKKKAISS